VTLQDTMMQNSLLERLEAMLKAQITGGSIVQQQHQTAMVGPYSSSEHRNSNDMELQLTALQGALASATGQMM
jgi:hypothetical protein